MITNTQPNLFDAKTGNSYNRVLPLVVGGLTITCEDNMELMSRYPDKYFDLAIVDPPYGIGAGAKSFINRNTANKRAEKFYKDNDWDKCTPPKEYWDELQRVSKKWIVWGGNYFTEYLPPARCFIVWDKKTGANSYADCELALTNIDSNARIITKFWLGAHAQDDDGRIHPTQKPIPLLEYLIKTYTNKNDLVLDNCAGSGSTGIACINTNRNCILIEKEKKYFDVINERIKNHINQQKLF